MSVIHRGSRNLRETAQLSILALLACGSIFYLAPKLLLPANITPEDYFDFQEFWLVGKIWASGQNPYDVVPFQKLFYESFQRSAGEIMWLYPPYWYPLIVPFAFFSFKTAFGIWKVFNFTLLIVATHLIARGLADVSRQKYVFIFLSGVVFVCFMQATAQTIWGGQTSILIYFGLSGMVFGLLKARPSALIIGLVFLALKPQIGIIAFAAVAALHRYRWTIFPAAGICLLGIAPVAVAGGYRASIEGFLANLSLQSKTVSLGPDLITGLIRFADYQSYISSTLLIGLTIIICAIVLTFLVFYHSPFNNELGVEDAQNQVACLTLFVAILFFFTPLHSYDLVSLAAMWMMLVAVPLAGRWLIAIGLLICFRPLNLLGVLMGPEAEQAAGGTATSGNIAFPISQLVTIGLFLLFVGAVWSAL